ncbi:MAG TPA: dolichyl-phosphate beta-glucosyltransferase [Oculatellaceae cyanobacterium]
MSVVIPAFNEESRLPATLSSINDYLTDHYDSFEVLVVDDGSTDRTSQVVQSHASVYPNVRLLSYGGNRGKGYAVRLGVIAAQGDFVLITDADRSSPIDEVANLLAVLDEGADIAIGSRAKFACDKKVESSLSRRFAGICFNVLVRSLLVRGIFDTQCGFKLFKREQAHELFSVAQSDGFAFDVEILHVAKLRGYSVFEVPINWSHCDGSKVSLLVDSPKMLLDIFQIAMRSARNAYRAKKTHNDITATRTIRGSLKQEATGRTGRIIR